MSKIKEAFIKDTKNHKLTVLLDTGLYRHLRLMNPESSDYWFDITTWPNHLCISGDMGCYTFSRIEDMFKFFRHKNGELETNPGYWSEKVQSGAFNRKNITMQWSQERFIENVRELLNESLSGLTLSEAKESVKNVHENILNCSDELESVEAIRNFEDDNVDFTDFFECSCEEFTHHYLWCCYAIVWAIQQYDNFKSEVANA